MKSIISFFSLLAVACTSQAQTVTRQSKPNLDMVKFFEGSWTGEGQFANGKKILAEASFQLSLDSCWLVYTHTDQLPNRYKAISIWGTDPSTRMFLAYLFDNFQGHRLFTGQGWQSGEVRFAYKDTVTSNRIPYQRFTYSKISTNSFKMTYEVSKDGFNWRLGDSLIFSRQVK